MPRIGMNPARGQKTDYRPSRVTLAMLTYLPNQTGYFEHRFDVTRLSLESLIAHTPQYDLIVFDNGSCKTLVDYLCNLRDAGKITHLILSSHNVGKIGALKTIFRAAPGELVAYSDDDVFYLPGWLEAHLRILDTFPNVGAVTGFYMRPLMAYAIQSTLDFSKQNDVVVEHGKLLVREMEKHYIDSMGRTWERYLRESEGLEDMVLTYKDVQAYVSAGHHQFVSRKQVILDVLPSVWSGRLMGQMREMDTAIDQLGLLRLCTREPVTRLLGNAISQEMADMARAYGLSARAADVDEMPPLLTRLYRLPSVRWLARHLYNWLFTVVNAK